MSPEAARAHLAEQAGESLDEEIVAAFIGLARTGVA
jgi:hypothetical protein